MRQVRDMSDHAMKLRVGLGKVDGSLSGGHPRRGSKCCFDV